MSFNEEESKKIVEKLSSLIVADLSLDKEDKIVSFSSVDEGFIRSFFFDAPLNLTVRVYPEGNIGIRAGYDFEFDYLIIDKKYTLDILSKFSDLYEEARIAALAKVKKKFGIV